MPERLSEVLVETTNKEVDVVTTDKEQYEEKKSTENKQEGDNDRKKEPYDAMRNEPHLVGLIVETYLGEKDERGFFHGVGTAYFKGNHVYSGSFVNGLMEGTGQYIWSNGIRYEGDFKNNKIEGKGSYTWPDESTYDGDVLDGLRHGRGTYSCGKIPSSYSGEWKLGERFGEGILRYDKEGLSYYDGHWVNNKRHGFGMRRYASGNVYKGDWRDNVRHGKGTMHWYDRNEIYEGQWENGTQHGHGEHSWYLKRIPGSQYPLRNYYVGEWLNGLRHGHGIFYYATGAKYEGEWMNNMKHGSGKYVFKNGLVFEGTFELDHMLDFPDINPSGMITPDITSSGLPVRSGTAMRSASPYLISDNSENPLNLNIDLLLDERDLDLYEREEELRSVTHVMLRHISKLKKIYSFYSCLGQHDSIDNTFVMSRLHFWRFLKDSKVHHHGFTLSELDHIIAPEKSSNFHEPHQEVLMREFLNAIVIIGYKLYNEDHSGNERVLPWCVSKLISENILQNYCKVGGSVFADSIRATEAVKLMPKSWNIFCGLCAPHVHYPHEPIFKCRQFMFMLNDFRLINSDLSPEEVLKLIAKDNPALAQDDFCNLELEMTFLEFFEALIDCASVYVTEAVIKGHLSPKPTSLASSRSPSADSFTPATSKPGLESPDEDQLNGAILAGETPGDRDSPERVCRVMSGASDTKSAGADSPSKTRDINPAGQTTSAKSTDPLPSSQEGSKKMQSFQSSANVQQQKEQSLGPAVLGDGEDENLQVEVQTPSLCVPAGDGSQFEQPDQQQIWCLQVEIFFDKFFQAADNVEIIKKAQEQKPSVA